MVLLLRILLYMQVVLGLTRFAGWLQNQRLWETHITLGVLITLLALLAFRPRPQAPTTGLAAVARFSPLIPLLTGLAIFSGVAGGPAFTLLHVVLGIATVGVIEAAAARAKRT